LVPSHSPAALPYAEDKDKGDAEDDNDKADAEADKGEAERDAD